MKRFFEAVEMSAIVLVTAVLAVGLWSCEKIYDYEGDCAPHWQVKFIYDYNMNFADAFPGSMGIGSVHLYVFDAESGRLVMEKEETAGPGGFASNYVMPIEQLPVGRYDFVAWCGLADNTSFTGGPVPQKIEWSASAWQLSDNVWNATGADRRIAPLYYGKQGGFAITDEQGTHTVPIYLIKDVNEFIITLQHRSKPLDPDDFDIIITDDNDVLLWDNSLAQSNQKKYHAWSVVQGTADDGKQPELSDEDPQASNVLISRLSICRLVDGRATQPCLSVTERSTGKKVFEFTIIPYLLMPGFHHALLDAHNQVHCLDDQEYLDREDTWNMHFILDDNLSAQGGWLALELHILDWHVILNKPVDLQ